MSWTSRFVTAVVTMAPFLSYTGWCRSATYKSATAIAPSAVTPWAGRRVRSGGRGRVQQVGTSLGRCFEGALAPPPRYRLVITGSQHLRHDAAAEVRPA